MSGAATFDLIQRNSFCQHNGAVFASDSAMHSRVRARKTSSKKQVQNTFLQLEGAL
jgi:hypothetical protein